METTSRAIRQDELLAQMGWIRELARGLVGDPNLAEDLAQEAWLAAAAAPPARVESEGGLRAWLAAVTRNLARKSGRSRSRRERRERAAARPEAQEATVDVVMRGSLHSELSAAVMGLEEPYRTAILLRYLDGLSAVEVAARQGVSHAAARKRISRGLAGLRARLDESHGGDRGAWSVALMSLVELQAPAKAASPILLTLPGGLAMSLKSAIFIGVPGLIFLALVIARLVSDPAVEGPDADTAALPVPPPGSEVGDAEGAAPVPGSRSDVAGPERGFELTAVDGGGAPWPDLLVLCLDGAELVARGRTDEEGRLQTELERSPERVVVGRAGLAPQLFELPAGGLSANIRIAAGASVSGAIEILEHDAPIPLELSSDRPFDALDELGAEARAAFEEEGIRLDSLRLELSGGEPFLFAGLSADWSGALLLDEGWRFVGEPEVGAVEDGRSLLLRGPAGPFPLRIAAPWILGGRARIEGSQAPAAGLLVLAAGGTPGSGAVEQIHAYTGEDGTFELALPAPPLGAGDWSLRVSLGDRVTDLEAEREFTRDELEADPDLGIFSLPGRRSLDVLVRDSRGALIAGARVTEASSRGRSTGATGVETDELGRATLTTRRGPDEEVHAQVYAPGFLTTLVPLSPTAPTEVVLEAGNSLGIQLTTPTGEAAEGLRLAVACERLPFSDQGLGGFASGLARRRAFRQVFELDERARLELGDLEPGLALSLVAVDELGTEVARRETFTPGPLEHIEVELVVARPAFHLRGRVLDGSGRPLPRAQLHLEGEEALFSARSDADGAFAIGPLYGPSDGMHLRASRAGFLDVSRSDLSVGPDTPELELVLTTGRELHVFVSDPDGRPVSVGWLFADCGEAGSGSGEELESGHYYIEELPRAAGLFRVRLGGIDYEGPFGAEESSATFELPALGVLTLVLDPAVELLPKARICVVFRALDREGIEDRHYFVHAGDAYRPVVLSLPVGRYSIQLEQRVLFSHPLKVERIGELREVEMGGGEQLTWTLP